MKKSIVAFIAGFLIGAPALAQMNGPAETIFARYQTLERSFDPAVADLYCDTALIRNIRTYPNGQQRTLDLPATNYKAAIRAAMPLAKARGDYSTYSGVTFDPDGANVRIRATRYSMIKKYSSPISLLVGPCNGGAWAILEELSESQP